MGLTMRSRQRLLRMQGGGRAWTEIGPFDRMESVTGRLGRPGEVYWPCGWYEVEEIERPEGKRTK